MIRKITKKVVVVTDVTTTAFRLPFDFKEENNDLPGTIIQSKGNKTLFNIGSSNRCGSWYQWKQELVRIVSFFFRRGPQQLDHTHLTCIRFCEMRNDHLSKTYQRR